MRLFSLLLFIYHPRLPFLSMSEHLEITGAVSPPEVEPEIAFRLEAYDFVKDIKRFSLYVQAMSAFQPL